MCYKSTKKDSAPGPDGIPAIFLKSCSDQVLNHLQKFFQKSLTEGKLPLEWKRAIVTPVFKNKGLNSDPANYRPISLTSILCKTMERIVKNELMRHFELNRFFSDTQFGFRSHRSTQTQLVSATTEWVRLLDDKVPVDVVYLVSTSVRPSTR